MVFRCMVLSRPDQDWKALLEPYDARTEVESYVLFSRDNAIRHARTQYGMVDETEDECVDEVARQWECVEDAYGNLTSTYNDQSKFSTYFLFSGFSNLDSEWYRQHYGAQSYDKTMDEYDVQALVMPDGVWHQVEDEDYCDEWEQRIKQELLDVAEPGLDIHVVECHV